MPREFSRLDRVADFLKQEVAQFVRFEIRDPRLADVNIVDVEVSRDIGHAKIFFTLIGTENEDEGKKAAELLNKAAGFLRKQLAKTHTMRSTPQLHFFYDASVLHGGQLSALIDSAIEKDKENHQDDLPEIPPSPPLTKGSS